MGKNRELEFRDYNELSQWIDSQESHDNFNFKQISTRSIGVVEAHLKDIKPSDVPKLSKYIEAKIAAIHQQEIRQSAFRIFLTRIKNFTLGRGATSNSEWSLSVYNRLTQKNLQDIEDYLSQHLGYAREKQASTQSELEFPADVKEKIRHLTDEDLKKFISLILEKRRGLAFEQLEKMILDSLSINSNPLSATDPVFTEEQLQKILTLFVGRAEQGLLLLTNLFAKLPSTASDSMSIEQQKFISLLPKYLVEDQLALIILLHQEKIEDPSLAYTVDQIRVKLNTLPTLKQYFAEAFLEHFLTTEQNLFIEQLLDEEHEEQAFNLKPLIVKLLNKQIDPLFINEITLIAAIEKNNQIKQKDLLQP